MGTIRQDTPCGTILMVVTQMLTELFPSFTKDVILALKGG